MDFYLILGLVFGILGIVLMIALVIGCGAFIIWFIRSWDKAKKQRQVNAETQRRQHNGQSVLEWVGPRAIGNPDPEFGPLVEEFPRKGGGSARFYERGLVLYQKRVPYGSLSDIFFDPGEAEQGKDLKEAIQNSAVLWLYRKGLHRTLAIRDFQYGFDHSSCEKIRDGLGFRND